MKVSKKILIIAGPNGAGKTSFATEFLPNEANCPNFINADLIAAGPESLSARRGRNSFGKVDAGTDSRLC